MKRSKFPEPIPYETERFTMRPMKTLPLAWRTYHWTKQAADLFQYLGWKTKGWSLYRWYRHIRKLNRPHVHCHTIISKETGELIGLFITYMDKQANGFGQQTILLGEQLWRGKGVHLETYAASLDYCFDYLNLHKLRGFLAADNRVSLKNNLAIGFVQEANLREEWLLPNGERTDKIMIGMFREEWQQKKKGL